MYLKTILMTTLLMMFGGAVYARHHYIKREVMIPMRDGTGLYAAIYIPNRAAKKSCPIVMMRTPYGCKPYGQEISDLFDRDYWKEYASRGYIIVSQDVRGRYHSEGTFVHLNPQEALDAYDTADWLVNNLPESNGRIGVVGCSYGGYFAFMAGVAGHPAIRIVSPQAPVTDWWMGDDMHHNGAFCPTGGGFLDYMQYGEQEDYQSLPNTQVSTQYDEYLNYGSIANLTQHLNSERNNDFWNEMVKHPDYDDWWQQLDTRRYVSQLKVPAILITGGAFDGEDYFGTIALYDAIVQQRPDIDCHRAIGPWTHGGWRRYTKKLGSWRFAYFTSPAKTYMRKVEIPMMEKYLHPQSTEAIDIAKEYFFITGANRWTTAPLSQPALQLYMHADGTLSAFHPQEGKSTYISDPANLVPSNEAKNDGKDYMYADQRFLQGRDDVLSFQTAPLQYDYTFRGNAQVHLSVSLTTEDADFFVKIIDVSPRGEQLMIRSEMMRGKYRKMQYGKPETYQPTPFSITEINDFEISLLPFNHTFKRGHRLMVQIQSSAFPLFDRNPQIFTDIYNCSPDDFVKSTITLHHSANHACYILLPSE